MNNLQIKLENDRLFREGNFPEMQSVYVPGTLTGTPAQRSDGFRVSEHTLRTDTISAILKYSDKHTCALNFANAMQPGGAYILGGNAQEEALCRASLLYYTIRDVSAYYRANRMHITPDYTHGMIYSSRVPILRSNAGEMLESPAESDFITCPAVNRTFAKAMFPSRKLNTLMQERIEQIILLAAQKHPEVLILGAFGCGVFGNKRETVYPLFEQAISRYLPDDIDVIFADPR